MPDARKSSLRQSSHEQNPKKQPIDSFFDDGLFDNLDLPDSSAPVTQFRPSSANMPKPDSVKKNKNLMSCPGCGNQVSKQALSCPKCGFPINASASDDAAANKAFLSLAQSNAAMMSKQQAQSGSGACTRISYSLSILGLFCFGIFLAPIALILAIVGLAQSERGAAGALILSIISFILNFLLVGFMAAGN
ncbi:zinc ribbon domain-containing protein [bacterium]|nr:zinc ribbon domain-containing protein [bacterium]